MYITIEKLADALEGVSIDKRTLSRNEYIENGFHNAVYSHVRTAGNSDSFAIYLTYSNDIISLNSVAINGFSIQSCRIFRCVVIDFG